MGTTANLGLKTYVSSDPYSYLDDNANLQKIDAGFAKAMKGGTAYNYLDNSYFGSLSMVVNQRGQTSYTGGNKYTVDRWVAPPSSTTVTLGSRSLSVGCTGAYECYIRQFIENGTEKFGGKTLTLAVKLTDGNVYIGTGTVPTTLPQSSIEVFVYVDLVVGKAQLLGRTDYGVFLQIGSSTGKTISIEWVALYEGAYTAATLPRYIPKGYAAELLECMRYYQKSDGLDDTMATTWGNNSIDTYVHLQVPMRDLPSVTIKTHQYWDGAKWVAITGSLTSANHKNKNGFIVRSANATGVQRLYAYETQIEWEATADL